MQTTVIYLIGETLTCIW